MTLTTSNLAIAILVVTIISFAVSLFARGRDNAQLNLFVKVMRVVILLMVAVYFYLRTSG